MDSLGFEDSINLGEFLRIFGNLSNLGELLSFLGRPQFG